MTERVIKFREAISEAFVQAFEQDETLFMMGCGVTDPKGIFNTTIEVSKKFAPNRVFDVPLSENSLTGIAVGAAVTGRHPILVHQRSDFLLLTLDQIVNHAAKWKYMSGGKLNVPLMIRSVVGRGWGQAAQHSQNVHSTLVQYPGLQVVLPSDAYDAKGLMMASLRSQAPVLFIEHRWLHEKEGEAPEKPYEVPLGKAAIKREGSDVTIIALSHMVLEARQAAESLEKEGISVEICDLRTVAPLDWETVFKSVQKTGRAIIADTGIQAFGISAEISARIYEEMGTLLRAPVKRIGLPFGPTPCSPALEKIYYPGKDQMIEVARTLCDRQAQNKIENEENIKTGQKEFIGPF